MSRSKYGARRKPVIMTAGSEHSIFEFELEKSLIYLNIPAFLTSHVMVDGRIRAGLVLGSYSFYVCTIYCQDNR